MILIGRERFVTITWRGGREERNGYLSVSVTHSWWKFAGHLGHKLRISLSPISTTACLSSHSDARGYAADSEGMLMSDEKFMLDSWIKASLTPSLTEEIGGRYWFYELLRAPPWPHQRAFQLGNENKALLPEGYRPEIGPNNDQIESRQVQYALYASKTGSESVCILSRAPWP
jgi:hypothetical protein